MKYLQPGTTKHGLFPTNGCLPNVQKPSDLKKKAI